MLLDCLRRLFLLTVVLRLMLEVPRCPVLVPLVVEEDRFFADSEAFDLVDFDQMVELAGIGYSFD